MTFEEIISKLKVEFGEEIILSTDENASPSCIELHADHLVETMQYLHQTEGLYFDALSCITGLDNGPETDTMEVIYNLYSIPCDHHLMVKVTLSRKEPLIDSLNSIWKTADWQEREVFDLFGIQFNNHPDLRRILLPADWEGFPLRKDYEHQTYYRGVKVAE
ncbi:NADH-quinone oxidoreductase subunit C [Roseivirga sp. E12]|uniref:NADH-quinone oxidoreductase subunit C n=1 Tax=Roseivirga sp. E12 TaxID=2819237 RepID=UPI001ABD1D4E|nr:NADH-quinone oxidoreductase subunit C [Roseivirga sp. E12]MBO3699124.1 NADH-quinone oxidoreductase subunit C [Roseivirga sp. E12]